MENNCKKEYGLVLSGGGGKGAYQIGALKALEEMGILPCITAVAGSSVGGLNMALLAEGDMEKAVNVWENISYRDFVSLDEMGFVPGQEGDGMFSREGIKRILRENVMLEKMASKDVRYYITVCHKDSTGKQLLDYVYMNERTKEEMEQYLLASSAIPLMYDNVEINGISYYDGGLMDNCPILPVYNNGKRKIIVISLDYQYQLPKEQFPGADFYVLRPSVNLDLNRVSGTIDFSKSGAAYRMKLGYLDTKAIMPALLLGEPLPDVSGNRGLAEHELQKSVITTKIEEDKAGLSRILGKYGVDL